MINKIVYAIGFITIVKSCFFNNLSEEQLNRLEEKITNIENKIKEDK